MRLPWLVVKCLTVGVACDKTCMLTPGNTCAESNILYKHGVLPVVDRVPREEWDYENPNFRDELALRTTPVIITNSPVAGWKAVSEWDLKSIVEKVGKNTVVYITDSRDGSFLYHSDSKAERANEEYEIPNGQHFMKFGEFVRIITRDSKKKKRKKKKKKTTQIVLQNSIGPGRRRVRSTQGGHTPKGRAVPTTRL